jgi:hypothetical protein
MSKTTRLAHPPKKTRYVSRYNKGGLVQSKEPKEPKEPGVVHIVSATAAAQNRPKKQIIVTSDRFNTYKTQRT